METPDTVVITVPSQLYNSIDEKGLKLKELDFTKCPLDYNLQSATLVNDNTDMMIVYALNYQDVYNSGHLYEQVIRYNPANLSDDILIQYHQLLITMLSDLFGEEISIANFIDTYYFHYDDMVLTLTEEIFNDGIPTDVMDWVQCFIDESFKIAIAEFQRLVSKNETYRVIVGEMDTLFEHKALLLYHPESYEVYDESYYSKQ